MTQYGQAEAFSLWVAAQNGQPFDPNALERADSMEEAVARLQLVAKTGIVSYVRIERREP